MRNVLGSLAALVLASAVCAQSDCPLGGKDAAAECDALKECTTAVAAKQVETEVNLAVFPEGVPTMTCVVGNQVTNCPVQAQEIATETGAPIEYIVAGVSYDEMRDAGKSYAKQLNRYLDELTSVQCAVGEECVSCPITARTLAKERGEPVVFRLAKYEYECPIEARRTATLASDAAEKVRMTITVDGTECCCPKMAEILTKKTGEPIAYTVGETTVHCDVQASCLLALARIRAAITAVEEARG